MCVVVVPVDEAEGVLEQARARMNKEEKLKPDLAAGNTVFGLLNMAPDRERLRVTVIDDVYPGKGQ